MRFPRASSSVYPVTFLKLSLTQRMRPSASMMMITFLLLETTSERSSASCSRGSMDGPTRQPAARDSAFAAPAFLPNSHFPIRRAWSLISMVPPF